MVGVIQVPPASGRGAAQARITASKSVSMLTVKPALRSRLCRLRVTRMAPGFKTARSAGDHHKMGSLSELYQGNIPLL